MATEAHCAPDGANEVSFNAASINISPLRGWDK